MSPCASIQSGLLVVVACGLGIAAAVAIAPIVKSKLTSLIKKIKGTKVPSIRVPDLTPGMILVPIAAAIIAVVMIGKAYDPNQKCYADISKPAEALAQK